MQINTLLFSEDCAQFLATLAGTVAAQRMAKREGGRLYKKEHFPK